MQFSSQTVGKSGPKGKSLRLLQVSNYSSEKSSQFYRTPVVSDYGSAAIQQAKDVKRSQSTNFNTVFNTPVTRTSSKHHQPRPRTESTKPSPSIAKWQA